MHILTPETLDAFFAEYQSKPSIVIPVLADSKAHPRLAHTSFLYIRMADDVYILPLDHNDAIRVHPKSFIEQLPKGYRVFTPSMRTLAHQFHGMTDALDLQTIEYLQTGKVTELETLLPTSLRAFCHAYYKHPNLNRVAPLMLLVGHCDAIAEHYKPYMAQTVPHGYTFYHSIVLPTLLEMENAGIHVDQEQFVERYGAWLRPQLHNTSLFHTQFNPFTATKRITSHFAGVNTSAINKRNGDRSMFTSRFTNGRMIMIDYESFHIRLIANMIGFKLPEGSCHEYFGKQYFQTDTLTPTQYEESKQRTFRMLYGDSMDTSIPFFAAVDVYIKSLFTKIGEQGYIQSEPTGIRIYLDQIDEPTPAKIFNYQLQLREMEVTMYAMAGAQQILQSKQSVMVLYTYDAILLDYDPVDGSRVLAEIVSTMECNGLYPVRIYVGKNYDALDDVTKRLKT